MESLPGTRGFLKNVWRKRPALYPEFVSRQTLRGFTTARFYQWCRLPVRARVYLRQESCTPGAALAWVLEPPSLGPALYEHYSVQGEPITLLLNRVNEVDAATDRLQSLFGIPYWWRCGDTVATLSCAAAGIGYHAGSEDGFIVQVRGSRRWSIWSRRHLSAKDARVLCGCSSEAGELLRMDRPRSRPVLECQLKPGDALYIPALFPHEGITERESLSFSVAWRGISLYDILTALGVDWPKAMSSAEATRMGLFSLLRDPPPDADPERFLTHELMRTFDRLEFASEAVAKIPHFVSSLLTEGIGAAGVRTSST